MFALYSIFLPCFLPRRNLIFMCTSVEMIKIDAQNHTTENQTTRWMRMSVQIKFFFVLSNFGKRSVGAFGDHNQNECWCQGYICMCLCVLKRVCAVHAKYIPHCVENKSNISPAYFLHQLSRSCSYSPHSNTI